MMLEFSLHKTHPAGTWRRNGIVPMSMRRHVLVVHNRYIIRPNVRMGVLSDIKKQTYLPVLIVFGLSLYPFGAELKSR